MVTGIGSVPFTDVDRAPDHGFAAGRQAPFWPQLAKRSFLENMYVQFLEGVPSIVIDEQNEKVYIDTGSTDGIERFYEDVASGNLEEIRLPGL